MKLRSLDPGPPRSPWQQLYGAGHRLRVRWWRERARHLPLPVVSVGNLHWGGTGKTPLVAAIGRRLEVEGLHVAILSRGYGSRGRGVRVVSRGGGPEIPVGEAGDEPYQLAGEVPGAAVVVAPDRHAAGIAALSLAPRPDLFLLDDGFSHLPLARDLDLLVLPHADPLGGGRLPPGGRLREPQAAAARAAAALVSGTGVSPGLVAEVAVALRAHGFRGEVFASPVAILAARDLATGTPLPAGERVVVATGIARPQRVADAVDATGLEVAASCAFPDHHDYPARSVARIAEAVRRTGARHVVTTAKDAAKLLGRLATPLAVLPVEARPERAFWEWLLPRVAALRERTAPGGAGPAPRTAGVER